MGTLVIYSSNQLYFELEATDRLADDNIPLYRFLSFIGQSFGFDYFRKSDTWEDDVGVYKFYKLL